MAVKKRKLSFIPERLRFSEGKGVLSKNYARKAIWICVLLCAMSVLSYHLATLIIEYKAYLVSTVEINHMYGFLFPNVTICRKQPFNSRKKPPEGIGIRSAMRFWKFALNLTDSADDREIAFEKAMSSFLEYAYERDIYTPILEDFHVCQYMDQACDLSDFHKIDFHGHFNCVVFAPKHRRFAMLGKHYGLRIILSSGNSYGVTSPTEQFNLQEGFNIMIHDNAGDIMEVMPWNLVTIRLKMKKYKRQNSPKKPCYDQNHWISSLRDVIEVHFPSEKYGQCHLGNDMTERECLCVKLMTLGLKECGCLPNSLTSPMPCSVHSMRSCHKLPRAFFYNDRIDTNGTIYYNSTAISLTNNTQFDDILKSVNCHDNRVILSDTITYRALDEGCPIRCLGINYETSVTSSRWPDRRHEMINSLATFQSVFHVAQGGRIDMKNFSHLNFSTLLMFPSTLNVEETTQEFAYPIVKLISDFGGTISLYVGISLVTLFEVFEVVLTLIAYKFTTKQLSDRNNEKVESNKKEIECNDLEQKMIAIS